MGGMTQRSGKPTWWEQPAARVLAWLTWEKAAYFALFAVALAMRLWNLGVRSMSHDESLHALFSWKLYAGQGYVHDPMMHGPFLFYANALVYFLFGVSDFTARLVPALFGASLAVLPYFLRKWMGRLGAFVSAIILTFSPSFLYYSRYIRNDIYIAVWSVLMLIALFRFLDERRDRYIFLFGIVALLSIATKEVAYITGFIFVVFVLWAVVWERLGASARAALRWALLAAGGAFLLVALGLTVRSGGSALTPTPRALPDLVLVACFVFAFGVAGFAWRQLGERAPVSEGLAAVRWRAVGWTALAAAVIFVVMYTTVFSNLKGLYSGTIGQIVYWLKQHGVQRGDQPWYYYFVLMPMYEFLPLLGALAGIVYYAFARRAADARKDSLPLVPFLIFWTIAATALYSWAGEKMPWLVLHPVLPMALLTGRLAQDWIGGVDWREAWRRGAAGFVLLVPFAVFVIARLFLLRPFAGMSLQRLTQTATWLLNAVVAVVVIWAVYSYATARLGVRFALRCVAVSALGLLFLLTVRFTWMANYVNYDTAKEFIVYAHGTQFVKQTMNEIAEISERLYGDKSIELSYDGGDLRDRANPRDDVGGLAWPLEWYLRDYPNRHYFQYWDGGTSASPQLFTVPVVLVDSCNEDKVRPFLGDKYYRFPTQSWRQLVWWPVEDYRNLTPARILNALKDPARRAEIWDILWWRKYKYTSDTWPNRHDFALYVRKDIAGLMWKYSIGVAAPQPTVVAEDPYQAKKVLVPAVLTFGRQGQGPGEFQDPRGVAVDAAGNIYVADTGNHRVQVFDANGKYLRGWGQYGSGPGEFNEPWGIAVDGEGNVYVADTWNYRVQKFDGTGKFLTMWGESGDTGGDAGALPGAFYGPRAVALARDGTVLVMDTGNKRIQRFTADGEFVGGYGGFGAGPGQFWEPVGLAVDGEGNVYVADTWNHRVQVLDREMRYVREWGVKTWAGESVLNKPYVAVDGRGHVYASDPEGHRVLEWTVGGEFVASYGEYGVDESRFSLPVGLAVDGSGRLIVADSGNHRIMVFAPFGP